MEKGTLYMVPCPIAEDGDMERVLPSYNAEVLRSINYFIYLKTIILHLYIYYYFCC